jgi:uncharacterized tellurite resistance protein B-like protein
MLDTLRRFMHDIGVSSGEDAFAVDDHRVAAAALLVHLIGVDGIVEQEERAALHDVLKARFDLNEHETAELIAAGQAREAESIDLFGFTSVLKRSLDAEGRANVVEMMWEIVFSNGAVHELEDNVVWRAAELLGVSARERVELKRRIAGRARPLGAATAGNP